MSDSLKELFEIIKSKQDGNPKKSYTAKLFKKGRKKISQKLGEEAAELIIEAIDRNPNNALSESADLLYHLFVLLVDMGIEYDELTNELKNRRGVSGIEEKKNRKKNV